MAVAGCSTGPAPAEVPEKNPAGGQPPIVIEGKDFRWESIGGYIKSVKLPFAFKNLLEDTLYIVNCNGAFSPVLEKKTATGWEIFLEHAGDAPESACDHCSGNCPQGHISLTGCPAGEQCRAGIPIQSIKGNV